MLDFWFVFGYYWFNIICGALPLLETEILTMSFIAAQVCALAGMVMLFSSFQAKSTLRICLLQCVACLFLTAQFVFLEAFTGAVLNGLSLVRNLVYACCEKRWAQHRVWPFVFSVMYIVSGMITWQDVFSLLPVMALVLSSFALRERDAQRARLLNFPASPMWLIYDAHTGAYLSIVTETLVMGSIILGLIRYRKKNKLS